MRSASPIILILLFILTAPFSYAAGRESKERSARKACLSGDYAKGIAILSDLFIDTMDANYIFNQGRCFEQNNRHEDAIGRFREYLRKAKNSSQAEKSDAARHIEDCQALLGKKEGPSPSAGQEGDLASGAKPKGDAVQGVPASAAPGVAASPSPAAPALLPAAASVTAAPQAGNPGRGLRIAGITCGAAGLAAVGTAVYYYSQARSYSDKVSSSHPPNPSDQEAGKDAQTMQWVFYSVGAAALATGTVLYVLGWPPADSGRGSVGIAPVVGPGLAGISAQGAF
jgi:hypothetical protein